jgi:6-phosphogluconate dehydrogenase
MRNLVDMRFGPGTWQGIVDERARRIQEAKEAERQAKIKAQQEHEEFVEGLKQSALISLIVATAAGLLFAAIALLPK